MTSRSLTPAEFRNNNLCRGAGNGVKEPMFTSAAENLFPVTEPSAQSLFMCDAFGKKQPAAADPPLIYVATSRRECVRAAEEGVRKPHGPFEAPLVESNQG